MKRVTDIFFGLILLIILSPLLVVVSVVVKLDSRGPVLNVATHLLKKPKLIFTSIQSGVEWTSKGELIWGPLLLSYH